MLLLVYQRASPTVNLPLVDGLHQCISSDLGIGWDRVCALAGEPPAISCYSNLPCKSPSQISSISSLKAQFVNQWKQIYRLIPRKDEVRFRAVQRNATPPPCWQGMKLDVTDSKNVEEVVKVPKSCGISGWSGWKPPCSPSRRSWIGVDPLFEKTVGIWILSDFVSNGEWFLQTERNAAQSTIFTNG